MLDGLIDKFCEEKGKECKIIATGGLAEKIICSCRHEITYDENIILDGMYNIYQKNNKNRYK
jgi:type III pantothenate kinase